MKRVAAVLMLSAAFALAGCAPDPLPTESPNAESSRPTVTPTPAPTPDETGPSAYSNIEELRLGFIDATGEACPPFSQYYDNADGVICTVDGWQLFWHSSIDERNHVLQLNVDSIESSPFVVGPNWLINGAQELAEFQVVADAMNASVWTRDLPIPAE